MPWLTVQTLISRIYDVCFFFFSPAPDQPVYNLLQLLSESGAPCQEDLPARLFMFLHSCQDETGQLKKFCLRNTSLKNKIHWCQNSCYCYYPCALKWCIVLVKPVLLQFTPVLYFWSVQFVPCLSISVSACLRLYFSMNNNN